MVSVGPTAVASRGWLVFTGASGPEVRDLREPEVRGRASDGATAATDMVFEREHQSGCDRRDRMMRHMRFFSISMGAVNNSIFNS